MNSYRKPAQRIDDVPPRKSWRTVAREHQDSALTCLLIIGAVVGALWLALADANDPKKSHRSYPVPLLVWADNMNSQISGTQCETTGDTMRCDVQLNGHAIHTVECRNGRCWLAKAQENRQ